MSSTSKAVEECDGAAEEENDGEAELLRSETGHDLEAEGVGSITMVYDREEVLAEAANRVGDCRGAPSRPQP